VHAEEDKRYFLQRQNKHYEDEVNSLIYGWDRIRTSKEAKERITKINAKKLVESHLALEEFKS
jgi:hypothetical protein